MQRDPGVIDGAPQGPVAKRLGQPHVEAGGFEVGVGERGDDCVQSAASRGHCDLLERDLTIAVAKRKAISALTNRAHAIRGTPCHASVT